MTKSILFEVLCGKIKAKNKALLSRKYLTAGHFCGIIRGLDRRSREPTVNVRSSVGLLHHG